jgi:alkanesulfonate monooxygenase SsuD/methylene tetrahydromethanopterin reductase-like flavin-dependent oxidoreductase (luciferase family)
VASIRFGYESPGVDPLTALELGILADKNGLDGFWVPDHYVDLDGERLDPWTILSAIAVRTKKLKLASAVTDTQRTHPSRAAHMIATVDTLSGGRVILGIGAGEAMNIVPYGLPWEGTADRIERLRESVQVIRLLWGSAKDRPVSFEGRFYHLKDAFLRQSPAQKPSPPVYIGAISSEKMLELVGQIGDGWYGWLNTPKSFKDKWSIIQKAARAAGRPANKIGSGTQLMVGFARNSEEKKEALLNAKLGLMVEKTLLKSMGLFPEENFSQYQTLLPLKVDGSKLVKLAESISDDVAYQVAAIGGVEEFQEKAEALSRAGLKQVVVSELSPPSVPKRTIEAVGKVIKRLG